MQISKTYLTILGLFAAFLVVSTLQLGKTRVTIDVLEKKKLNADTSLYAGDHLRDVIRLYPGIVEDRSDVAIMPTSSVKASPADAPRIYASPGNTAAWFGLAPSGIKPE